MKKALSLIILVLSFSLISCVHADIGNGWQTGNGWQGASTPTPTPSPTPAFSPPSNITSDDAMGIAIVFGVIAISLAITFPIILMRRREKINYELVSFWYSLSFLRRGWVRLIILRTKREV